ncbi:hypothetical protein PRIPAC_87877 [Pristionchus pacificus]|uniref:Aldo_ket_red domain-containing protein n=1 Tax=Pristionchus pacificus TaxID=54126 RepID=A0A2A6CVW2_PRIPA|nr:hypothetical protein PRIPAC_87877 [Pristionchus pacificus]|eukprot:PDM82325.1 hypothetical protein PRIPAC_36718 [Pristionchus pacificus]
MVNDRRKRSYFSGLVADLTNEFAAEKSHSSIVQDFADVPSTSSFSTQPDTVTLSNGVRMPLLGLGTTHSGGYYHDAVLHALRHSGYRMIDTARRYGLWSTDYGAGVEQAFTKQCAKLQIGYLDLYMLHFPDVPDWLGKPRQVREDTWRRMELLYDAGKCRSIGVSNFDVADLDELEDYASILPHVNQCEYHALYDPTELREYCTEQGVLFTGYCPLAKGRALNNETIQQIARKHARTPAQICLRWSIENGIPVIPKSKDIARIEENAQIFDFSLSPEDHEIISSLNSPSNKVLKHEDLSTKWNLPDGYKLAGRVFGVPTGAPIDTQQINKPPTYRIQKLQSITISPAMKYKGF